MFTRCFLIVLILVESKYLMAADRITGKTFAGRSEVVARNGVAATSHPLATQVAIDILKSGGNAVDAAIAANAMLGLVEPMSCGIGGDLFAIVWDSKSKKLHGLNASGRSPKALSIDEFHKRGLTSIPAVGPLPVSVPGCVDGWFELHSKFGELPMDRVLRPAIEYAKDGFAVTEVIAHDWRGGLALREQPGFSETFLPNGKAPNKGDVFRNPNLAKTLELIARRGRDAFYKDSIATTIDAGMKRHGGFLSQDDLASHKSEWVDPVSIDYRGYRVWELPPNGQGIAALQMLQVLKGFDVAKWGFGSAAHLHYFVEAKKLAFEDRAKYYADPAFSKIPVDRLISDDYADSRRMLISPDRAAKRYDPGSIALEQGDTIYLTVADRHRNMVSLIQSNYRGFGSGICPDGLGFCLQNRGQLFNLDPSHANAYAPGKRPFHTIIPAFITSNGQPLICFGVMGGATQPQGHVQIVMNIVDFGMNLQEAGDAPRVVHTGSSEPTGEVMINGGRVNLESGFGTETVRELVAMGHDIGHAIGAYGGYQAIRYDSERDVYFAASESRKDGHAAGY